MYENKFIQKFYLNFLCFKELFDDAFYFTISLDLDKNDFPSRLLNYINENSEKMKMIKEKVKK